MGILAALVIGAIAGGPRIDRARRRFRADRQIVVGIIGALVSAGWLLPQLGAPPAGTLGQIPRTLAR